MISSLTFLTLFVSMLSLVFASPVSERQDSKSQSFSKLQKPILSPYYVDFGESSPKKLSDAYDSLKMNAVTLGFLAAKTGKCEIVPLMTQFIDDDDIKSFIGKGGSLSISFGGRLEDSKDKQHIHEACGDETSLAKLIEEQMDTYHTNNIEFDIEDKDTLANTIAMNRLAKTLALIGADAFIIITLGAGITGMWNEQMNYLKAFKSENINIDILTLMAMNLGDGQHSVVDNIEACMSAGASQFGSIYGMDQNEALKRMGVLPAIGLDDQGQTLSLSGAKDVANWAKSKPLTMVSYWNFNRDFKGTDSTGKPTDHYSSDPSQTNDSEFFSAIHSALFDSSSGESKVAGAAKDVAAAADSARPVPSGDGTDHKDDKTPSTGPVGAVNKGESAIEPDTAVSASGSSESAADKKSQASKPSASASGSTSRSSKSVSTPHSSTIQASPSTNSVRTEAGINVDE